MGQRFDEETRVANQIWDAEKAAAEAAKLNLPEYLAKINEQNKKIKDQNELRDLAARSRDALLDEIRKKARIEEFNAVVESDRRAIEAEHRRIRAERD